MSSCAAGRDPGPVAEIDVFNAERSDMIDAALIATGG
jgi:hypothetical protein